MESAGATFLDIEQIDAGLNEVAGHLNAQHARLTDLTVALLADESAWAGPGVYRAEQYLAWKTGLSLTRAKQIVTIARRAAELPVSMDAFRHGELAVDQIYAIALRAPWWADREVCELARYATVHQLRNALGRYPFPEIPNPYATPEPQPDPDPEPQSEPQPKSQPRAEPAPPAPGPTPTAPVDRIWFGLGDDGRFRLSVDCDELTGMIITNALTRSTRPTVPQRPRRRHVGRRPAGNRRTLARHRHRSRPTRPLPHSHPHRHRRIMLQRPRLEPARRHPPLHHLRRPPHPHPPRRHHPHLDRANRTHHPRTHPPPRHTPRPGLQRLGLHPNPHPRSAPHHPLGRRRPDRHLELDRAVSAPPPTPPQGHTRHHRQRRRRHRGVHRPQRQPPHTIRSQTRAPRGATTTPERDLPTPPRRTPRLRMVVLQPARPTPTHRLAPQNRITHNRLNRRTRREPTVR